MFSNCATVKQSTPTKTNKKRTFLLHISRAYHIFVEVNMKEITKTHIAKATEVLSYIYIVIPSYLARMRYSYYSHMLFMHLFLYFTKYMNRYVLARIDKQKCANKWIFDNFTVLVVHIVDDKIINKPYPFTNILF